MPQGAAETGRLRRCLRLLALALCSSSLIAGFPAVASSAFPGANGRLIFATTWAPDLEQGEVFSISVDGGEADDISRTTSVSEESPLVSPDATRIAWIGRATGTALRDLYVSPLSGSPALQITFGMNVASAAWSPDSRRIAFEGSDGVYIAAADGSAVRKLDGVYGLPSWSPDGESIAFTAYTDPETRPRIAVAAIDATVTRYVAVGTSPAWSPDGTRIAYQAFDDDSSSLSLVDAAGGVSRRVVDEVPSQIAWSPDARSLAFTTSEGDGTAVHVVDLATGEEHTTITGYELRAAWSPDSSELAIGVITLEPDRRQEIILVRPDGTAAKTVVPATGAQLSAPSWSRDGHLYYSSIRYGNDFDIVTLDPLTGAESPLTSDPLEDVEPAWSPDGTKVAFVRGPREPERDDVSESKDVAGSIYVMTANGRNVRRLTRGHDDNSPAWSPDGRRIVFEREGALYLMTVVGRPHLRRLTDPEEESLAPAWSPDGRRIAFERWYDEDEAYSIAMVALADGRVTRSTDADANDRAPSWRPNSRELVFERDTGRGEQLFTLSVNGGHPTGLTSPRPCSGCFRDLAEWSAPVWSPDGGSIAFIRYGYSSSALYVMTRRGAPEWRLTGTPGATLSPDWQAIRR